VDFRPYWPLGLALIRTNLVRTFRGRILTRRPYAIRSYTPFWTTLQAQQFSMQACAPLSEPRSEDMNWWRAVAERNGGWPVAPTAILMNVILFRVEHPRPQPSSEA
jgi:hypothetical protein